MRALCLLLSMSIAQIANAQSDVPEYLVIEVAQDIRTPNTVAASSFAGPGAASLAILVAIVVLVGLD
jgi:hypothetical protein